MVWGIQTVVSLMNGASPARKDDPEDNSHSTRRHSRESLRREDIGHRVREGGSRSNQPVTARRVQEGEEASHASPYERELDSRADPESVYNPDHTGRRRRGKHRRALDDAQKMKMLEAEKETALNENKRLLGEIEDYEHRNRGLEREVNNSRKKLRDLELQVRSLEDNIKSERQYSRDTQEEIQRYSMELKVLKDELSRAEGQHELTRRLLEGRTVELNGAQRFLTQTDSLSGAEVIAIMESLNAEILQTAAFMADSLEFGGRRPGGRYIGKETLQSIKEILGRDLMGILEIAQTAPEYDPTPVQIALQVTMTSYCDMVTALWSWGGDDKNRFLKRIYTKIHETEQQAVSGRWRSMTQAQAKKIDPNGHLQPHLTQTLLSILGFVGWFPEPSAFEQTFKERLSTVNSLCFRLNTAMGEAVTSVDILPLRIKPGVKFASTHMQDTYAEERQIERNPPIPTKNDEEFVAGTTDLGLERIIKESDGSLRHDTLLKPKVILCSALEEYLG